MAQRFPGLLDPERVRRVRSMYDFDDVVTAPLHGFDGTTTTGAADRRSPGSGRSRVPTLVLNARNDPFIPAASLPGAGEVSADVLLEQPAGGGHAGFVSGPFPGNVGWLPRAVGTIPDPRPVIRRHGPLPSVRRPRRAPPILDPRSR